MAYNAFLKGTEADTLQGIEYADRAIARDPDFARAYIQKAWLLQDLAKYRKNWNEATREMESLARTAIRLDPYDANGHILLAWALGTLGKNAEALAETNRALELNPSSADILNTAADSMSFLGKPEEGAEMCDRSFRLNPTPPDWYYSDCVTNLYFIGRLPGGDRGGEPRRRLHRADALDARLEGGEPGGARPGRRRQRRRSRTCRSLYWEVSFEWLLNTGWNFERTQGAGADPRIVEEGRASGSAPRLTSWQDFSAPKRLPECTSGGTG